MRPWVLLAALGVSLNVAADDDLTPERAAQIDRDQTKALEAVDKKYGNKKPSELSNDERRAMINDRAAAEREVLQKNNVSAKSYTNYSAKMSREDRATAKAASERLDEKEKAEAGREKGALPDGFKEIPLEGADPIVENGLPPEGPDDRADSTQRPAPAKTKRRAKNK